MHTLLAGRSHFRRCLGRFCFSPCTGACDQLIVMKRALLVLCTGGMLAFGVIAWGNWRYLETPSAVPRFNQQMQADPALKLVSQQSPYIRTER